MNRLQRKHVTQCRAHERNRRIQFNQNIGKETEEQNGAYFAPLESRPFEQAEIEFYTDREETILS